MADTASKQKIKAKSMEQKISWWDKPTREVLLGFALLIFALVIILYDLLKIDLRIEFLLTLLCFILGVINHLEFFRQKSNLTNLHWGSLFLLLSVLPAESFLDNVPLNVLAFFIFFQIFASCLMAYLMLKKKPYLLTVGGFSLFLIVLSLIFRAFSLKFRASVILWFVSGLCALIYKEKKSLFPLFASLLFLIFGFEEIVGFEENYLAALLLWFIAAGFLFIYLKYPAHSWLILPSSVFIMAGFVFFNYNLSLISGKGLLILSLFWLSGTFIFLWRLRSRYEGMWWAVWLAVLLAAGAVVILLSGYFSIESLITSAALILVGLTIIMRMFRGKTGGHI